MSSKFLFAVLSATGGSAFVHGFHVGVLNILCTVIHDWYANIQKSRSARVDEFMVGPFFLASFSLGGILGGLLIAPFANGLGRKGALLSTNAIVLVGLVLLSFSHFARSYELFVLGRIILGMAAGLNSGLCPMYLIEISPDNMRGAVGTFYYVSVAGCILAAYFLALPEVLGRPKSWPFLFIFACFPTFVHAFMLVFCPESPKFLFINKEDEDEAEAALAWLRDDKIDESMEDLREEASVLEELGPVTFERLLYDETVRTPLIICTVIMFGQQVCGIDMVLYYTSLVLKSLKYQTTNVAFTTIGIGLANFVAAIASMFFVERIGRKLLLMISFGGIIVSMVALVVLVALSGVDNDYKQLTDAAVTFLFIYVILFALGAGTIPWFLTAELCNHLARPMSISIAVTVNWFTHFIVVMSYIWMLQGAGTFVFMVYFVFDVGVFLFIIITLRETMGMVTVDIIELFYD